jgi:hypothetical protein
LFYDRPLDAEWRAAAESLRERCGFRGVVGRAKGEREVRCCELCVCVIAVMCAYIVIALPR